MKTKRERSLSELTPENKCEGKNSGCGKKQAYDGRAFRALFKRQSSIKAAAAIAEKLVVDLFQGKALTLVTHQSSEQVSRKDMH
ncbi:hypothetical protein ACET3Z_004314 [Daucus carota]